MAKRIDFQAIQKLMRKKKTPEKKITYLLEQTSPEAIREAKKFSEKLERYHWKFYYELAQQREAILDKLKATLLGSVTEQFVFQKWQRAVKWQFSSHPMCVLGSTRFVGQRFNYGEEINSQITAFPALYIASDKDTALQETLGQSGDKNQGLTAKEIALSNPQSESIVSLSGELDQVFDLRDEKKLREFVRLISKFKLSKDLVALAKEIGDNPEIVTTVKVMQSTLLDPNWRERPVQNLVPSNSQIFGNLIAGCGIHGIVYPSKLTEQDCIAVFVQNFGNSDSYLKFDDNRPDERVPERIDASNFETVFKNYGQIVSH